MKKLLALLLVMVLALATLTACDIKGMFGKGEEENNEENQNNNENNNENNETPVKENYAKNAVDYLDALYEEASEITATNYELVSKYTVPGTTVTIDITWTTNVTSVTIAPSATEGRVTVTLPEAPAADVEYTITATVTDANGNTETRSYDRVVPAADNYMSIDEYYAANKGETVVIKGIVTGVINKTNGQQYNQLHLQDETNKGGYYVYNILNTSIDDIKVGMTVKVSGEKNISYGVDRIEKANVTIVDTTIKTVTPVDYTNIYLEADTLTNSTLNKYDGLLVTLKGVEITGQNTSNGYYKFLLGNKESYVRISSSTCCLSKDEVNTFKTTHTNNKGKLADVVGVVTSYDNAFYLVPVSVDAYFNFRESNRTPADKMNYELDGITLPTTVKKDTVVDLVAKGSVYTDIAITWTSNNACAVVSEDGKTLTIEIGDTEQTVTITATATLGSDTKTKEFTVKVAAKPEFIVKSVTAPVAGKAYMLCMYQGNLDQDLYFTGKMSGFYFATSGDVSQGIQVYLEETTGGYYLWGTVDNVKKYFNIVYGLGTDNKYHTNVVADFEPHSVYTFDAKYQTLVTIENETKYFLGTYGTNKTLSATDYNKYAASNFIARLVEVVSAIGKTDAEKIAIEKDNLTIDTTVTENVEIQLPKAVLNGVAIEWAVSNNAEINDGKLVITMGDAAKTVTLTATITAGSATDTKVFTFEVPKLDGIQADLETMPNSTSYNRKESTNGWVAEYAATSSKEMGFEVLILNGKTSEVGTLTSPVLKGGLTKITFNYTNIYSESKGVDITIEIIQNGTTVASKKLDDDSVTKCVAESFVWVLETAIEGDYQIKITNNCPSKNSSSNKDRVSIWNLRYTPVEEECQHTYSTDCDSVCNTCEQTTRDVDCVDTLDKNGICDNAGCGKAVVGGEGPTVEKEPD